MDITLKKCITPMFRTSFENVMTPRAFRGQPPMYSCVMLFPKKEGLGDLLTIAKAAAEEKWGQRAEQVIAKLKGTKNWPFHDGDKEKPDIVGYPGHYFVTAKAKEKNPPGVVDARRKPIIDEKEFYSGCYARAEVLAYAYDNEFGKGVGFSLLNVQKLKDGEMFTGKKKAEDVFENFDDGSEDSTNYGEGDEATADMGF